MENRKPSPAHVALFSVFTLGLFAVLYPLFEEKEPDEDHEEKDVAKQPSPPSNSST